MENKEQKTMFELFPVAELGRMLSNIDRFDTEVPNPKKIIADEAITKAEELTNKIIDENL